MEHHTTLTTKTTIRVHLLRSQKPQRCSQCGWRRILITIALYPAGLSPEVWMCMDCAGIRVSAVSVAPSGPTDNATLWPEGPEDKEPTE